MGLLISTIAIIAVTSIGFLLTELYNYYRIYYAVLNWYQFEDALFKHNNIYRIDVDMVDADNFVAVILLLKFLNKIYKGKGILILHIIIIGRVFSSENAPSISNSNKMIAFEDEKGDKLEIDSVSFFKDINNIAQGHDFKYDKTESEMLKGICAAQLRVLLSSLGFEENIHFKMYDGGIPTLPGINHKIHMLEFYRLCFINSTLTDTLKIKQKQEDWFNMTRYKRKEEFRGIYDSIQVNKTLLPLSTFNDMCYSFINKLKPLVIYGAGPCTPLKDFPDDLARRVAYYAAMSTAWDGTQNILGTCFNNAVDFEATKTVFNNMFPFAVILLIPTETCKLPDFIPTPKQIDTIVEYANVSDAAIKVKEIQDQWNTYKGSSQPIFDVFPILPISYLFEYFLVHQVKINMSGTNPKYPEGHILHLISMMLENCGDVSTRDIIHRGITCATHKKNDTQASNYIEDIGGMLK